MLQIKLFCRQILISIFESVQFKDHHSFLSVVCISKILWHICTDISYYSANTEYLWQENIVLCYQPMDQSISIGNLLNLWTRYTKKNYVKWRQSPL